MDALPPSLDALDESAHLDFVHTGPGTLAGSYLRRFWQPVCVSRDLSKGQAIPIRLMGEDFTLYRGQSGKAHLVSPRCPHRGTQLSVGVVSGDNISCVYHGWTFNQSGECVAQPAERHPFCQKVRIDSYPTQEAMGLVFSYVAPQPPPLLPRFPGLGDIAHRHRMDCNFFQSAENIMDDVHLHFSHRNSLLRHSRRAGIPRVSAKETPFGLTQELRHENSVEFNHFIMPNMCYLEFDLSMMSRTMTTVSLLFYYVPIDDFHHNHFMTGTLTAPKTVKKLIRILSHRVSRYRGDEWFSRQTSRILSGKASLKNFSDPRLQDTVMCVGQGVIANRKSERLGTTDAGVILLRNVWKRELRLLSEGKSLTPVMLPGEGMPSAQQQL